jgi:hypothetical protein
VSGPAARRRRTAAALRLAVLAALAAFAPRAGAQELVVEGPREPVLLGERFELVVRGTLDAGATLELGELPPSLRAGEARLEATPDGLRLVQPLRATRQGELRLEQLEVVEGETRRTLPPVELQVVLPLPDGALPRVADPLPTPAVPAEPRVLWPWLAGLGLALLAAAGWALLRLRFARPEVLRYTPPDQVAIAALAQLRLHPPQVADAVPPFVDAVSAILRRYVEHRFGLRAPESTTEEFLAAVAARGDAVSGRRDELRAFLERCDLVKFARARPAPADVLPLVDVAEGFVEATR